jgi:hypothetical protein
MFEVISASDLSTLEFRTQDEPGEKRNWTVAGYGPDSIKAWHYRDILAVRLET